MIIIEEFKKNIKFFISMALVLTLLMAAGVSLFNFSFELNKKIYGSIGEEFKDGYEVRLDGFTRISDTLKANGVSYASYGWTSKKVSGLDNSFFNLHVYHFEDYLPKSFLYAMNSDAGFLISGSLWLSSDNAKTDGKSPLFISSAVVESAAGLGVGLKVGDTLDLCEARFDENFESVDGIPRQFFIKGIYKQPDYNFPDAVISLNAEIEYAQDRPEGDIFSFTYLILNEVDDYKRFSAYASKAGLDYFASIEEDIGIANLFSVMFGVISVSVLLFCGMIAFVYCNMYINRRLNFIGLLKALGQTGAGICRQIFALLIIIFGVSLIIGNVFSILLTSHFAGLALTLFDYSLNVGFNPLSQAVFSLLTLLTAFLSVLLLYGRINKIDIARTLTQRE